MHLAGRLGVPFGLDEYSQNFSSHTPAFTLSKRVTVDFNEYVCKGIRYLNMILLDPPTTEIYTQRDVDKGWTTSSSDEIDEESGVGGYIQPFLNSLGMATEQRGTDFEIVTLTQSREFTDESGQTHRTTNGGAIVATDNYSPRHYAGATGAVPRLNRWSDVVWYIWTYFCTRKGKPVGSLRYIVRDNIITDTTKAIMELIAGAGPAALDLPWPGRVFDMNSEEVLALLATSHGAGIAYMIKDHSDVLRRREPKVHIFTIAGDYYMWWDLGTNPSV
ncbi:MAG: hypothetical protein Q9166_007272 [cf. Caloplaca sp. 2 TL-2023]